jgi:HD-GYP domain-containing protein (c-di-GMP phosphodiesterase class II)
MKDGTGKLRKPFLITAILFAAVLFGYLFLKDDESFDLASRKIICHSLLECAVMQDGSAVLNDGGRSVLCIGTDGRLRYRIRAGISESFTGITLDDQDNLYFYRSEEAHDGSRVLSDSIQCYDKNGRYLRTLATLSYAEGEESITVRTSPLHYENGKLYYTCYGVYESEITAVDADGGGSTSLGKVTGSSPFLYNDIEGHENGFYNYARVSGEVGRGKIGGTETALAANPYRIRENSGIRPFYTRYADGQLYVYDYYAGKLLLASGSRLTPVAVTTDFDYGTDMTEFSSCGKYLCGISSNIPWYILDGRLTKLPSSASIPVLAVFLGILGSFLQHAALPILCILGLLLLIFLLRFFIIRRRKFFWKLISSSLIVFALITGLIFFIFSKERSAYLLQIAVRQRHETELAAEIVNADSLKNISDSGFFESDGYKTITEKLIAHFSVFQSSSDTAAVVLVPGSAADTNLMVASNRGFGGLLGNSSELDTIISKLPEGENSVVSQVGNMMMTCARITGTGSETAGYLVLYTTERSVMDQFISLWSLPVLLNGLLLLLFVMLVSSRMISSSLNRIRSSITQITEGNFSVRLRKLPNDEIGDVGRCVNKLAANIESLIAEKSALDSQLKKSQEEVLVSLAEITEEKSGQTSSHIRRVSEYVRILAPSFGFTGNELEYLSIASMLHDIGKLLVPEEILEKPGKLTPEEFRVMKLHTTDGEKLLHNAPGRIMEYARVIAAEHHERWDGTGYMKGLKGADIHLEARITSVADVYDALVSRRSYKAAMTPEKAYDIIVSESGKQFDPAVVDAFKKCFEAFLQVMNRYPDAKEAA